MTLQLHYVGTQYAMAEQSSAGVTLDSLFSAILKMQAMIRQLGSDLIEEKEANRVLRETVAAEV